MLWLVVFLPLVTLKMRGTEGKSEMPSKWQTLGTMEGDGVNEQKRKSSVAKLCDSFSSLFKKMFIYLFSRGGGRGKERDRGSQASSTLAAQSQG